MNALEQKLFEKLKEVIDYLKNQFGSVTDNNYNGIKKLESEVILLESEIKKQKITDADIEAWAAMKVNQINPNEWGYGDLLIEGAKAALNGEIKHIENENDTCE